MNKRTWTKLVKERDGYICQDCRKKGDSLTLHAHHIKPSALGGKNVLENGITLCDPCHRKAHSGDMSPHAIAKRAANVISARHIGWILGVSSSTIYSWQKRGYLKAPADFEAIEKCIDKLEREGRVTALTPEQMRVELARNRASYERWGRL